MFSFLLRVAWSRSLFHLLASFINVLFSFFPSVMMSVEAAEPQQWSEPSQRAECPTFLTGDQYKF